MEVFEKHKHAVCCDVLFLNYASENEVYFEQRESDDVLAIFVPFLVFMPESFNGGIQHDADAESLGLYPSLN